MMGTHYAPVDAGERDLAAAQLDDMALAHEGAPWNAWKGAVVEWHLQRIANVRAEAWVPGLAGARDPAVEHALGRFYGHGARTTIARLKAENIELRRRLLDAIACARFYAGGAADAGGRAHALLVKLLAAEAGTPAAPAAPGATTAAAKRGQRH